MNYTKIIKRPKTTEQILMDDYHKARNDYENAVTLFNFAEGDYIDIAIAEMDIAERKMNVAMQKARVYGM